MNGVPGALQNRDPACRARQVNSRYLLAVSTILTCIFTNGFTNEIFQYVYAYNTIFKILYCHF